MAKDSPRRDMRRNVFEKKEEAIKIPRSKLLEEKQKSKSRPDLVPVILDFNIHHKKI